MNRIEANKAVVRAAIAALNDRDLDRFFSLHTDDTTSHEVYFPQPLGREEFRAFLDEFLHAYPDAHIETLGMTGEGDVVAVENVLTATFAGEFRGVQPTNRPYTAREAVFFELVNGKIRAARIYIDQKSIEAQLGLSQVSA
jgi:steroid delta-isomerase-like uncharacterized protein